MARAQVGLPCDHVGTYHFNFFYILPFDGQARPFEGTAGFVDAPDNISNDDGTTSGLRITRETPNSQLNDGPIHMAYSALARPKA